MKIHRVALLGALVVLFLAGRTAADGWGPPSGGFGDPSIGNLDSGIQDLEGLSAVGAVQRRATTVVTPSRLRGALSLLRGPQRHEPVAPARSTPRPSCPAPSSL